MLPTGPGPVPFLAGRALGGQQSTRFWPAPWVLRMPCFHCSVLKIKKAWKQGKPASLFFLNPPQTRLLFPKHLLRPWVRVECDGEVCGTWLWVTHYKMRYSPEWSVVRGREDSEGWSSHQDGAWARRKPLPSGFLVPWWAGWGGDRMLERGTRHHEGPVAPAGGTRVLRHHANTSPDPGLRSIPDPHHLESPWSVT